MSKADKKKKKKKKKPTGFVGKNVRRVKIGTKAFGVGKKYVYPAILLAFAAFAAWIGVTPKSDNDF